jgi:hypothetical protein
LFDLLINSTNNILENILIGKPEINKKEGGHNKVAEDETGKIACEITGFAVFVVDLKFYDLAHVDDHKNKWNNAIVDNKLREGLTERPYKSEAMTVGDVACNVKGHRKTSQNSAHDEETGKAHVVLIFRIKKKIRDPQVLAETSRNHRKQHEPAQNQYMVALKVIQKKLDRK